MKNLVILDSGHAEYVEGKQAPDKSLREWDFNNQIQYKLKKRCEDHNIDVYLTNPSPKGKDEMGLTKRANLANSYWSSKNKPNALFISIHANAHLSNFSSARGTETFVANNASTNSKNAAKYIQNEIVKEIKTIDKDAKDRGVKVEDFTVIYKTNIPAILIEYAFYTNEEDLKILKNNKDDLVEATMIGICKYFNIEYKALTSNSNNNNNNNNNNNSNNTNNNTDTNIYYRVVAGSYKDKSNAEDTVKELKKLGFDAFIVTHNNKN